MYVCVLCCISHWASLVPQSVKNSPTIQETWFDPWIGKIPCRKAWHLTPVFLPGESPWTEEPGGLQPMGLQRVRHDLETTHVKVLEIKKMSCNYILCKVYSSVSFKIFTWLGNHHHSVILEHLYHLKEEEGSNLTTSSQTLVIACLFCSSCPRGCEVAL